MLGWHAHARKCALEDTRHDVTSASWVKHADAAAVHQRESYDTEMVDSEGVVGEKEMYVSQMLCHEETPEEKSPSRSSSPKQRRCSFSHLWKI
jgi:hypothetical protein